MFLFLDGDDRLSRNSFEKLVKQAKNYKLDVLIFKNIFHAQILKKVIVDNSDNNFFDNFKSKVFNHFDLNKEDLFSICNSSCNKLYLKSFLEKNNIKFTNKNLIHENYLFFFNVMTSARRISVIDEYFYNKRDYKTAITNSKYERIFDDIEICNSILKIFLSDIQLYEHLILVIVIDDRSDDGSRSIIKKYSQKYKNIVPIFFKRKYFISQ